MVVNDLHLLRSDVGPHESDPPLVIDPDAVLPSSIAFKSFEPRRAVSQPEPLSGELSSGSATAATARFAQRAGCDPNYRGNMDAARVLQIGIDPAVVDFSPWPGQDADTLRSRIATAEQSLRDAGYDVTVCLLPDDANIADSTVRRYLTDGSYDVIEIGAGLRTSHTYTEIFERVVNTLLACRPGGRVCFNDSPESTLDAVRRACALRR